MAAERKAYCCFINPDTNVSCLSDADYVIYKGSSHEDYTHACAVHLKPMLSDAGLTRSESQRIGTKYTCDHLEPETGDVCGLMAFYELASTAREPTYKHLCRPHLEAALRNADLYRHTVNRIGDGGHAQDDGSRRCGFEHRNGVRCVREAFFHLLGGAGEGSYACHSHAGMMLPDTPAAAVVRLKPEGSSGTIYGGGRYSELQLAGLAEEFGKLDKGLGDLAPPGPGLEEAQRTLREALRALEEHVARHGFKRR